jgi:SAM-dependent methyltransferase
MTGAIRAEGVRQVVRFNWPTFLGATLVAAGGTALAGMPGLPASLRRAALGLAAGSAAGLATSLGATWWTYDRSELSDWGWLIDLLPASPQTWANVTTGFDDTTARLRHILPGSAGTPVDLFDPTHPGARSIRRARALHPPEHGTLAGRPGWLPLADGSVDAVFLLLAAHELRDPDERAALFGECLRVVSPAGRVVLVEHLRDLANGLVFGPGVLHFHSRTTWLGAADVAGLVLDAERSITPFVRAFAWRGSGGG